MLTSEIGYGLTHLILIGDPCAGVTVKYIEDWTVKDIEI